MDRELGAGKPDRGDRFYRGRANRNALRNSLVEYPAAALPRVSLNRVHQRDDIVQHNDHNRADNCVERRLVYRLGRIGRSRKSQYHSGDGAVTDLRHPASLLAFAKVARNR